MTQVFDQNVIEARNLRTLIGGSANSDKTAGELMGESNPLASLMWERDMWGNATWTVDWLHDEEDVVWFWAPNFRCIDDMMEWSNMPQELV